MNYVRNITAVVLVAVAIGIVLIGKPQVNVSVAPSSPTPVQVNVPKYDVAQTVSKLGAVSGPDFWYRVISMNGVQYWNESKDMLTATTTLCSFMTPSATTSLQFVSFQIYTGTSTAATIDIATSTTAYATTTNLVSGKAVAASSQGYAVWTPTGGSLDDTILSPNVYVNIKTAGAGLGGYTFRGKCKVSGIILGEGTY